MNAERLCACAEPNLWEELNPTDATGMRDSNTGLSRDSCLRGIKPVSCVRKQPVRSAERFKAYCSGLRAAPRIRRSRSAALCGCKYPEQAR